LQSRVQELLARIRAEFPVGPVPGTGEVVAHDCEECAEVREDFSGRRWSDVPVGVLLKHSTALPLFGDRAHIYYLPAYLSASVAPGGGQLVDWVVYDLCPERPQRWNDRYRAITRGQRSVVSGWLSLVMDFDWHFSTDMRFATMAMELYWS
jgi:hypothetical protein